MKFKDELILIGVSCAVYLQGLFYPPLYDDVEFISKNPITYDPLAITRILTSTYTGHLRQSISYRPLTVWSFALNRGFNSLLSLDPMHPASFHWVNILLHAAVVCVFYRFLLLLNQPRTRSLFAALIFSVLPIHVEAVTGIVGRAELFAALFGLLFLSSHLRGKTTKACAFYLLAMLGKESAVAFFPILIALDWARSQAKNRFQWRPCHSAYLACMLLWLGLRYSVISLQHEYLGFEDNPIIAASSLERILSAAKYQVEYLIRILLPHSLSSDSSYNQLPVISSILDPGVLAFAALFFGGLIYAWKKRRTEPYLGFFFLMYCFAFALTSNIIRPVGALVAERWAYAPSLAICALVAMGLGKLIGEKRKAYVWVLATLALSYAALTVHQNLSWANELTFFTTQVHTAPNSAKAHYNLGCALAKEGRTSDAISEYREAIRIFPFYSEPFYNLGNALRVSGSPPDKVIEAYRHAILYDPGHQGALGNLLIFLRAQGRTEEASSIAAVLTQINPRHPALTSGR